MIKYIIYHCLSTTIYGGCPGAMQTDAFGRPTGQVTLACCATTTKECGLQKEFTNKETANAFYDICKKSKDIDSLKFETVKTEIVK